LARTLIAEGWRRNVWALTLIVFIAYVGFQFNAPFLPLYVHELGVDDPGLIALWSGVLAAVTPAVSGVLGPFFGRLADRFGRKLMLVRSLVAFVVIIAVMGLVRSVEQLFVARFVQGLFAGFSRWRWPWPACRPRATRCRPRSAWCSPRSC
jgi:DHA1 family multidrug resistance protein-like MFS transporter